MTPLAFQDEGCIQLDVDHGQGNPGVKKQNATFTNLERRALHWVIELSDSDSHVQAPADHFGANIQAIRFLIWL